MDAGLATLPDRRRKIQFGSEDCRAGQRLGCLPPMDALGWHPAKTVFSSGIVV
jgi:hypothetical protein